MGRSEATAASRQPQLRSMQYVLSRDSWVSWNSLMFRSQCVPPWGLLQNVLRLSIQHRLAAISDAGGNFCKILPIANAYDSKSPGVEKIVLSQKAQSSRQFLTQSLPSLDCPCHSITIFLSSPQQIFRTFANASPNKIFERLWYIHILRVL